MGTLYGSDSVSSDSINTFDPMCFQGERLSYHLVYQGIVAADSRIRLQNQDSLTHLTWDVKTKPLISLLFHIENRYEIVIDAKRAQLLQVHKTINQTNIQQHWRINYDWPALKARTNQSFEWPIVDGCAHILSLLYHLRGNYSNGDHVSYTLDVESHLWHATGLVEPSHETNAQYKVILSFSPVHDPQPRAWKTDLLTNRLAGTGSKLTLHFGGEPRYVPVLIQFGDQLEMRMTESRFGD